MSSRITEAEQERFRRLLGRVRSINATAEQRDELPEAQTKAFLEDVENALLPLTGTEASLTNRRA
jgi:hypothetical protein